MADEQAKQQEAQARAARQQQAQAAQKADADRARASREASLSPPQAAGKPTPTPQELAEIAAGTRSIDDKEPDGSPVEPPGENVLRSGAAPQR